MRATKYFLRQTLCPEQLRYTLCRLCSFRPFAAQSHALRKAELLLMAGFRQLGSQSTSEDTDATQQRPRQLARAPDGGGRQSCPHRARFAAPRRRHSQKPVILPVTHSPTSASRKELFNSILSVGFGCKLHCLISISAVLPSP